MYIDEPGLVFPVPFRHCQSLRELYFFLPSHLFFIPYFHRHSSSSTIFERGVDYSTILTHTAVPLRKERKPSSNLCPAFSMAPQPKSPAASVSGGLQDVDVAEQVAVAAPS